MCGIRASSTRRCRWGLHRLQWDDEKNFNREWTLMNTNNCNSIRVDSCPFVVPSFVWNVFQMRCHWLFGVLMLAASLLGTGCAEQPVARPSIIPQPMNMAFTQGHFHITDETRIVIQTGTRDSGEFL